jgi:hypothetical protein
MCGGGGGGVVGRGKRIRNGLDVELILDLIERGERKIVCW